MIERNIPNLSKSQILFPLIGTNEPTKENYINAIEKFEIACEKSLKETLSRLGIKSTVKTDRYSLPYDSESVCILPGESYMNGSYELYRAIRPFISDILRRGLWKLRFYIYIEIQDPQGHNYMGSVKYHFRYFTHR